MLQMLMENALLQTLVTMVRAVMVTFSKNSASTSGISLTDHRIYITKSEHFPFIFVGEEAYILWKLYEAVSLEITHK
jgi:Zn/Cd-binding protein ZinT